MKKKLLLGAALGLALLANTAFAISADYVNGLVHSVIPTMTGM